MMPGTVRDRPDFPPGSLADRRTTAAVTFRDRAGISGVPGRMGSSRSCPYHLWCSGGPVDSPARSKNADTMPMA